MTNDPWIDRLSEYVDGELDDVTSAALEGHLVTCDECRAITEDLRQIAVRARALPELPARRDLWPEIERQIHGQDVIPIAPRRRGLYVSWPRLAAAGLLIGLASSGAALGYLHWKQPDRVAVSATPSPTVVPGTPVLAARASVPVSQSTAKAVADLEMILASEKLDTATVRILSQNLALIDSAIADAERALAADPSNVYVSRHLASTARRKVELLHLVAGLTQSRS